jgi:uncharacterized protein with GYD domain
MPKYLYTVSYGPEGAKGVLKDGGSKRKQIIERAVKDAGGRVEVFYFAFGAVDAYLIVDLPDNVTSAAIALAVNASGAASSRTTVLLTAEEMDQVAQKKFTYVPPGS